MSKLETEAALRARFIEACAERDAIRAAAAPIRAERDLLQNDVDVVVAQQNVLADQFKAIEVPLYDLDNEIAAISRALRGKTGDPNAAPEQAVAPELAKAAKPGKVGG